MPNTVAQHAVATFTSPVNGSTPIDANTVRGNDNTTRTSYNNHDADPGIHVQSSTLASRPVAGTSGRKWITADAGSYKLWYDDGTIWHEVANTGVDVFVVAGETLAKGDVVKVTGYSNGLSAPIVAKVASASDVAFGIVLATISNGSTGYIANTGLVTDLNTNAFAIGDILYPNTSGGFTSTKPVAGTYQPVAYVLRSNTNNGVLYVEFSAPRIVERSDNTVSTLVLRDASGNFAAGTITANLTGNISGTAPAGTLTGTTLASNVVSSSLTSVGTLTNLTVTNTIVGSVNGNAATATALATARTINGVSFNGTADITVTAAAGTLTGATLASNVLASSLTSVGTLAALTVTAPITGSVTGSSGSTTGNAATATTLATPRNINGVSFNGSADITVTAAAGTLSGSTLASGVTASSLTSVGTLTALTVSGTTTLNGNTTVGDATSDTVSFTARANSDLVPSTDNARDLGTSALKWRTVFATTFTENGAPVVSQTDIGSAANEIPLNQYLGTLAFQDATFPTVGQLQRSYVTLANNTAAQALGTNFATQVGIDADTTLTTTVPAAGTNAVVVIVTVGASSRTVTFGTGFASTGTLATGTNADRRFVVNFLSDGTRLLEVSRTTAITV